jgi:hypothetical protein
LSLIYHLDNCSSCAATLREAIRGTPKWLGFNIELKFPTDAEIAAMTTRWYTRNYFVDAILKVPSRPHSGQEFPRRPVSENSIVMITGCHMRSVVTVLWQPTRPIM